MRSVRNTSAVPSPEAKAAPPGWPPGRRKTPPGLRAPVQRVPGAAPLRTARRRRTAGRPCGRCGMRGWPRSRGPARPRGRPAPGSRASPSSGRRNPRDQRENTRGRRLSAPPGARRRSSRRAADPARRSPGPGRSRARCGHDAHWHSRGGIRNGRSVPVRRGRRASSLRYSSRAAPSWLPAIMTTATPRSNASRAMVLSSSLTASGGGTARSKTSPAMTTASACTVSTRASSPPRVNAWSSVRRRLWKRRPKCQSAVWMKRMDFAPAGHSKSRPMLAYGADTNRTPGAAYSSEGCSRICSRAAARASRAARTVLNRPSAAKGLARKSTSSPPLPSKTAASWV